MCCELEDRTGLSYDAVTARVNAGRVTELRWLLWAALQPYHALAIDDVGAVIDQAGGVSAIRVVLRAFFALNIDTTPVDAEAGDTPTDDRPGSVWQRLAIDARPLLASDDAFWQLSLKELWLLKATLRAQQRADRNRVVTQAWWTSLLVWRGFAGKMPELTSLLHTEKTAQQPARKQTWQEMRDIFRWVANAGQQTPVKGT